MKNTTPTPRAFMTDQIGVATVVYSEYLREHGISPQFLFKFHIADQISIIFPEVDIDWANDLETKFRHQELLIEPSQAFKIYGLIRSQLNSYKHAKAPRV